MAQFCNNCKAQLIRKAKGALIIKRLEHKERLINEGSGKNKKMLLVENDALW